MRKLALAAMIMGAFAFPACGGGGDDDGNVNFADAGPTADAGGGTAACNPLTQTGCDPGQKCTQVTYQEDPFLGKTECVADGSVDLGGACTQGDPGATTGFDDCKAGGLCSGQVCTEICTQTPETCGDGEACVQFADLFDDLDEGPGYGLCAPTCNPVTQDCAGDQACYLQFTNGQGTCANVPTPAAALTQDTECYGPSAGTCYLNGCAKGYQAIIPPDPDAQSVVCTAFCTPVSTYSDVDNGGAVVGDKDGTTPDCAVGTIGKPNHECRFVQSFYSDTDNVAETIGMCADASTWGTCTTCDIKTILAFTTQAEFDAFCNDAANAGKCDCTGCVSLADETALAPASAKPWLKNLTKPAPKGFSLPVDGFEQGNPGGIQ